MAIMAIKALLSMNTVFAKINNEPRTVLSEVFAI